MGADPEGPDLLAAAGALADDLRRWRRHLHAHPELSGHETETAEYIAAELAAEGCDARRPLPNAVVADIGGRRAGPGVAVRADIDALPIQEETGLPFASTRPGVMHACGHDGHTAILLGVARLLAGPAPPERAVRLIFQPSEEVPPGGAAPLIERGVLQGIGAIIGLHLWAPLRRGAAVAATGPAWAAADRFRAVIRGRSGHGAIPHRAVDALETACRAVLDLQSVISRRVDPLTPAVLTVGSLHAGQAFNVIAGEAVLEGTVRAFDEDVRRLVKRQVHDVLRHAAAESGAQAEVEYVDGYPALHNDPAVTAVVRDAAARCLGAEAVAAGPPQMAADDFARYLREVPGCYLTLGAGGPDAYPHHHPGFSIDEQALPLGVAILTEAALRLAAGP